jgi:hypothetical protein
MVLAYVLKFRPEVQNAVPHRQYCSSHVKEGKGGNVKLLPYFPVNDQIQTCLPKEESGFCQTLEKSEEPDKSFTVTTPTRNEDK